MILRGLGLLAPVAAGGMYVGGVFDPAYSRDIAKPPALVMRAVSDLEIAHARGGGYPAIRLEREERSMTWAVIARNRVLARMTATFDPINDGTATRVRARVESGDAPAEWSPPAFRSPQVAMGLFAGAIDDELDELVLPRATIASLSPPMGEAGRR